MARTKSRLSQDEVRQVVTIRIKPRLQRIYQGLAKDEDRSLSSLVERALEAYLKQRNIRSTQVVADAIADHNARLTANARAQMVSKRPPGPVKPPSTARHLKVIDGKE